jgi:c-di-GMP-binding flagellar brake protein YcgR
MIERRKSPRFQVRQMIAYFPGREEYLWAEGVDLSLDGLKCRSKEPLDPLTTIYFMLELPVEGKVETIRCEGFVAHSHCEDGACSFGIQFQDMSETDKRHLEDYLVGMRAREQA